MKKYNFYVNKKGYGKKYSELKRERDLILEEFFSLAEDYNRTLEALIDSNPLLCTICLTELAFHLDNVKQIKNLKNKCDFLD